jgi:hypothetical protein
MERIMRMLMGWRIYWTELRRREKMRMRLG